MPYNQNKTNYRTLFAEIKQISTYTKIVSVQWEQEPVNSGLQIHEDCILMESSLQR